MSRFYHTEVDFEPASKRLRSKLRVLLEKWGMRIEGETEQPDFVMHGKKKVLVNSTPGWNFWGAMSLAGGQTEDDSHAELVEMLKKAFPKGLRPHAKSRWLCWDFVQWHAECGESDEDNAEDDHVVAAGG